jgi:DNA-binding MarR family transcriptional regulator
MPDSDQPFAGIHHSPDEILAHPRYATARAAYLEAVLSLYEGESFLNRLLLEAGRQVPFIVILCLHCNHDEADRATWPTIRLLKQQMKQFGLSSPRRIDALVARLVGIGFLESLPSRQDGRVRILVPTAKMIAHDLNWLAAHYRPLHVMFPDPGYSAPIERDLSFQRAQRLEALGFLALGAQILSSNPDMMLFHKRDAGVIILIKLLQMATASGHKDAGGLSYADIGARFGVSRTHVRMMLLEAERGGLVALSGRGGRLVELKPPILRAFDRFVAESMSGHDLLFKLALSKMTSPAGTNY